METTLERLERDRRYMLAGFLVGFVAWQMADILRTLLPDMPWQYGFLLPLASFAGILGFLWYGCRIWKLQRAAKADPAIESSLNDERTREMRNASLAFGFWAVLLYMAGMRLLYLVGWVSEHDAFWQLGIVVAASSVIGHYLYKEWRDDE